MLKLKVEDKEMKKIIMLGLALGMALASLGCCFVPFCHDGGGHYGHGRHRGDYYGYGYRR
jgi:hypothetical protein